MRMISNAIRSITRRLGVPGTLGLFVLVAIAVACLLAPVLPLSNPTQGDLLNATRPPVWDGGTMSHVLGTDALGRDMLSRLVYGGRVTLLVIVLATAVAGAIGWPLGIIAAWRGGWMDSIITRVIDGFLAVPPILVGLIAAVIFGGSVTGLVIVISSFLWVQYARQARGEVRRLRSAAFVDLARVGGARGRTIIVRHILPNTIDAFLVVSALQIGLVVLLEAALSFLGVGVPAPTASWGSMVADGSDELAVAWWIALCPAAVLVLVVLSANAFANGLRDALDPRIGPTVGTGGRV